MSVWELYTKLFVKNEDAKDLREVCLKGTQRRSERKTLSWQREMVELINSDPADLDALVTYDESWIYCYDPETEFPVEACWLSQTQEGQTEQIHPQTFDDPFLTALAWSTCTRFPLDSQQGILCWGFKGVQEEIPSEEASTLQIESVAFPRGQCDSSSPSL